MTAGSSAANKTLIGRTSSFVAATLTLVTMFYLFFRKSPSFWVQLILVVLLAAAVSVIGFRSQQPEHRN